MSNLQQLARGSVATTARDAEMVGLHHMQDHFETTKHILEREKQGEQQRGTQLSSTLQNLISSVSLIFSQSQSSTLRSDVEFVNLLIKFIIIVAIAISVEIYVTQRLVLDKIRFGRIAIKVTLALIQIIRSYYMYLLLTLIRDQIAATVADELWDSFNIVPALIIVLLYLSLQEVSQYVMSKKL